MTGFPKPSKTVKKKKKSGSERKKLIKECDDLVREILFLTEDSCITCGQKLGRYHPQNNPHGLQVGHYKSRTIFPLRWLLTNCHLQCARENYIHENDSLPYTLAMLKLGGEPLLQELQDLHDIYKRQAKTMPTTLIREIKEELTKEYERLNGR